MVDAPEKSVGKVKLVSVLRIRGVVWSLWLESKDESWTWVVKDSEEQGRSGGEGGRHKAHSNGRTCVQRTDLGPCASQKCVSASWRGH